MKRVPLVATLLLVSACKLFTGSDIVEEPVVDNNDDSPGGGAVPTTPPPPSTPTNTSCTGTIAQAALVNVVVPAGARCDLIGSTLSGTVQVLQGAQLYMVSSEVKGDVSGEKASVVHVSGGTVGGNINIVEGDSPNSDGVSIRAGTVVTNGNIKIQKMRTSRVVVADVIVLRGNMVIKENTTTVTLDIIRNEIRSGNLEVEKNRGTSDKLVSGNVVDGKLECRDNSMPFVGRPNEADKREGQCSR